MHYLDYNENRTHGTDGFPMAFYHVDAAHPRYAMPYHWHPEYEVIRILKGNFTLSLNSEEIAAETGDVIFIPDGVIHGGIPHECVYECLVFDIGLLMNGSEVCRNIVRKIKDHRRTVLPVFRGQGQETAGLSQAVDRLFTYAGQDFPGVELCLAGSLAEIFGWLHRCGQIITTNAEQGQNRQKMEQLRSVLRCIEENYASPLTLDQLSAQAGMSPKYFCRFFESIVHKTPIEYLNYYRIERACQELADTELSVTEVGYNCGFHDTSYFIRIFKREKGLTPRKYQLGIRSLS